MGAISTLNVERVYVHTYIHTYVHTYVRAYVCAYVHTYVHTCVRKRQDISTLFNMSPFISTLKSYL